MNYREKLLRQQYKNQLQELQEQLERKRGKKQTYKGELEQVEKDLNLILNNWTFDKKPCKTAEEFINKFGKWINDFQASHKNYLETLQEKQELEFKYNELETERKNWLTPYLGKIESLEKQLFNLAKQKISNQKGAKELVKELENNQQKDKEQHEKDREWWSSELAKSKGEISELEKELRKTKQKRDSYLENIKVKEEIIEDYKQEIKTNETTHKNLLNKLDKYLQEL